jgi:hypothetical protein
MKQVDKMRRTDAKITKAANELNEALRDIARPPTPGYYKLNSPARAAARSRAKAFYPFD